MLYLFVLAILLINLGFGFAAASFVGMGPAIKVDLSRLPFIRRRCDASATTFKSLSALDDYQLGLDRGREMLRQHREAASRNGGSWVEVGGCLMNTLDSSVLAVDLVHQRFMILGDQFDAQRWRMFIESSVKDLVASVSALTEQKSHMRNADNPDFFEGIANDIKYVQVLMRKLSERLPEIEPETDQMEQLTVDFNSLFLPFVVESNFRIRNLQLDMLDRAIAQMIDQPDTDVSSWCEDHRSMIELGRKRHLGASSVSADKSMQLIGLIQIDRIVEAADKLGRFTTSLATSLMFDQLREVATELDVKLARCGNAIVAYGSTESSEEFTTRLDQLRQHIEQTTFELGMSEFMFTATAIGRQDDLSRELSNLVNELLSAYTEAMIYGENRTYQWEHESAIPCAPATCSITKSPIIIK